MQQYGQPYYYPPRRKSRVGLVFAIIGASFVTLLAAGVVTWRLIDLNIPGGVPAANAPVEGACAFTPALLQRIDATNAARGTDGMGSDGTRFVECTYFTLQGTADNRDRNFYVSARHSPTPAKADEHWAELTRGYASRSKPLPGLGDQAMISVDGGDTTRAQIIVRAGNSTASVGYAGFDKGFFGKSGCDEADAIRAATDLTKELLAKLT
ncbi:hypothetical protein SAMN05421504_106335 [Amycolatopsis xylanica]|uniref:DUF3558 domain-containing protein n=1 Tax=Amycolatopsis xylanica TaxID=589385 RepID=A0A1H3LSH5_9PSEU|nr:hypothetical protein [Amycolatopsis xylanica]SDY67270.1 hypothetical protein SAMN05421504_106335 [Amycolatopsis xylanica]